MDQILSIVSTISPAGVVLLAVLMVFRGTLMPGSTHAKITDTLDERAKLAEARADKAESQRDELLARFEIITHLLQEIRNAAMEEGNK